ncbi:hypothetical protein NP233_g6043 [Leucocoprinus birnbaumii]|uniref:DUF7587 domain-containing protein n=1 Tax=Leucocoprinus birnbaumii TaxID=56174 RepID=A0AAD5VV80_9AGAR|nr:hypothetical protein NP233_g6043 [Leucocoprinus birnbaumii]
MTLNSSAFASESGILPQHGYRSDTRLQSLLSENPYLFRIYTPKERSPFFDDTDPYFLAPKFNERYARSPVEIRDHQQFIDEWNVSFADVVKHMDWTTRITSPFISTSLSFAWCIWDALRRFHQGVKKDVQVAIIDGRAIADRAATAVELLELSSPNQRNKDYWKWHRFSEESQSVLVHGAIPGTAVLASIPLLSILRHMPSYFFKSGFDTHNTENPLIGVGWDYTDKKMTYRRFCRDMSNRFYSLNMEERLAGSTAGSLTLALAFLRPWFHRTVDVDCELAVKTLTNLASIIAQWPGQLWIPTREAWAPTQGRVSRLQGVVDELHEVVREYEGKFKHLDGRPRTSQSKRPTLSINPNPTPPVFSPPPVLGSLLSPTRSVSAPVKIQTPLTPPDTPRSSSFTSSLCVPPITFSRSSDNPDTTRDRSTLSRGGIIQAQSLGIPTTPLTAAAASSINALANQSLSPSSDDNLSDNLSPKKLAAKPNLSSIALTPPLRQPQYSHTSFSALSDIRPEEIPLPPSPFQNNDIVVQSRAEEALLSPSSITDDDSWTMILSQTDSDDLDSDSDDRTQVDGDVSYQKDLHDSVATLRDTEDSPPGSPTLVMAPLPAASSSKQGLEYVPPRPRSGIFAEPLEFDPTHVDFIHEPLHRRSRLLETAGRFATGFFIGAFITIAIFSPQRRMIIHLT